MNRLFLIQLVTSFLVGGTFIALQSTIAERVSKRMAGIVLTIPSTIAISFFFIGWTLSPAHIAQIVPINIMSMSSVFVFLIVYLYMSKIKLPKPLSIAACLIGSLAAWLGIMIPLVGLQFQSIALAVATFAIAGSLGYIFITLIPKGESVQTPLRYTVAQKIGRAAFAGSIVALAVFLSKTLNPFWGGIFTGFPAVFLSTLLILHWHYDSAFLFRTFKNVPLPFVVFLAYTFTAKYAFPAFGIIAGTLMAYAASLVVFLVLIASYKRPRRT